MADPDFAFLYPRTVKVQRPNAQTGQGKLGYGGTVQDGFTDIASGIRCNIERRREGQRNPVGLPFDGKMTSWTVTIPLEAGVADGTIIDKDVLQDDLGRRFQVIADFTAGLGPALTVERLET